MKKLLITIAAITAISTQAQAKEIHLDCAYATTEGRSGTTKIMLDTERMVATTYDRTFTKVYQKSLFNKGGAKHFEVGGGNGDLYTDGSVYWFSVPDTNGWDKFQIDRNSLNIMMDGMNPYPEGQCHIIAKPTNNNQI